MGYKSLRGVVNMAHDVYLYGMNLVSTIHLLKGDYPQADAYQEIKETHVCPGGETANAAIILAKLGLKVLIDGPFLGTETAPVFLSYMKKYGIDTSVLKTDKTYPGLRDLVLVDKNHRTVFGIFGEFLFGKKKRWAKPEALGIADAAVVSIDPFFGKASVDAARDCVKLKRPYVSIDCPYDSYIHKNAAVNVISGEFREREYKGKDPVILFEKYVKNASGLTIMTFGAKEVLYARPGEKPRKFTPFKVKVKGTLGAGDSFRAGIIYAILKDMHDDEAIRFASAVAASVCMKFPVADNAPTMKDIKAVMKL